MRNYLRSNYEEAFSVQNLYAVNAEGGIALWEMPSKFQNAYNPIIFRRTHWYFMTDGYTPPQGNNLNFVTLYGASAIRFMYPLASDVIIRSRRDTTISSFTMNKGSQVAAVGWLDEVLDVTVVSTGTNKDEKYTYLPANNSEGDSFIVYDGKVLYLASADIDTSYLDIYKPDGTLGIKLGAESFNGVTTFDVSGVVRTWFAEQLTDSENAIAADARLSIKYTVKGIGGVGTTYDMVAINGVSQIGENSDRTADVGKVLTCYDRLSLYDGYLLDYSVLSDAPISTPNGNTIATAISRVTVNGREEVLETETANVNVFDEAGLPIFLLPTFNIPVFGRCVPDQPFYVRWINHLGGVDYYMFARRQEFQPKVKSSSTYEVYVENTNTARTNAKAHAISTENTVVVGAEGIPDREYAALARLPFAPTIEWYNERLGKWIAVTVSKFDGKQQSDTPCTDIEIVFNLPTINTQF